MHRTFVSVWLPMARMGRAGMNLRRQVLSSTIAFRGPTQVNRCQTTVGSVAVWA